MKLSSEEAGLRVDHAVAQALRRYGREVSVREVRAALKRRAILVDGRRAAPGALAGGAELIDAGAFVPRAEFRIEPDAAAAERLGRIHEDEELLVVSKPSGMFCQPLGDESGGTALHGVSHWAPMVLDVGTPQEGGLVHRLDFGTSGVLLFAKRESMWVRLRHWFRTSQISKSYLAWTHGRPNARVVAVPLGGKGPRVRAFAVGARPARSQLRVVPTSMTATPDVHCVMVRTQTGCRHQVRAHLAEAGAPILGDAVYGEADDGVPRLALHAYRVRLPDGRVFTAPVDDTFRALPTALASARR